MRNLPNSWNNTLTKLGFNRKRRKAKKAQLQSSRCLRMEGLEERKVLSASSVLADYVDLSEISLQPTYTTVDAPANHETATGTGADGVTLINIATATGNFICSGALLPTGSHILTAAHCLTDSGGNLNATGVNVTFELPGGDIVVPVAVNDITIHPNWNGVLGDGDDIAVLELASLAPAAAERYDIYREANELTLIGNKFGYGQSGQGQVDTVSFPAGTKRDGQNLYELYWNNKEDIILYDFDNGLAANDTFDLIAGLVDLGLGNLEVLTAPGDSGGPTLVNGRIAGVTSFSAIASGGTGDSVPGSNSSFGEFGGDTRVSTQASWIDSVVDIVAPQVTAVTIAGPNTLDGFNGSYTIPTGSGEQLRTVPIGGADIISITFNEDVVLDGTELTLEGAFTTNDYTSSLSYVGYNAGTNTASWELTPLDANDQFDTDQMVLRLDDAVTDDAGVFLDGEWTNPTSLSQGSIGLSDLSNGSGNGTAGGDFEFYFTILPGDFVGDSGPNNIVDTPDLSVLLGNFSQPPGSQTYLEGDFTGDGDVHTPDLSLLLGNDGIDFTNWPGASQQAQSSGGSGSRTATVAASVSATDAAFASMAYSMQDDVDDDPFAFGSPFAA